jgi:bacillithiol synthase
LVITSSYIPYKETKSFSKLVTDYLDFSAALRPFYAFEPTGEGLSNAIEARKQYPVDKVLLHNTLSDQYAQLAMHDRVSHNITSLLDANTYTVCTAHQPNLLTGYLYFIYKILHTIKLADTLNTEHPDKHFVPIYYMGSEDNDLDELGVFRFRGDTYRWDAGGQTGAVGRMTTSSLKPLLAEVFKYFGPPNETTDWLRETIKTAYLKHDTIAEATTHLVNELFGHYGLLVINPDQAKLKSTFITIMRDELLFGTSAKVLQQPIAALGAQYKIQAHPREINLFYLNNGVRERIERAGDRWTVLNTTLQFNESQLLTELAEHPERFSPNVILRGLYQETILPNIAFIGGGAEVAYWMELRDLFQHHGVYYPTVIVRQSAVWLVPEAAALQTKLHVTTNQLFLKPDEIVTEMVIAENGDRLDLSTEKEMIQRAFEEAVAKAKLIDPTLEPHGKALAHSIAKQLDNLNQKMLRAERRKATTLAIRVSKLKGYTNPNGGLQERVENFLDYYLLYGQAFFDTVYAGILPFSPQFLILKTFT